MLIHYLSLTLKNVCNSEFSKSKLVTLSFLFITTKITLFYVFVWIDTLIANCFPVVEMFLLFSKYHTNSIFKYKVLLALVHCEY